MVGPFKSIIIETWPDLRLNKASLTLSTIFFCFSWSPWLKLSLATLRPSSISFTITSGSSVLGLQLISIYPIVQTVFVLLRGLIFYERSMSALRDPSIESILNISALGIWVNFWKVLASLRSIGIVKRLYLYGSFDYLKDQRFRIAKMWNSALLLILSKYDKLKATNLHAINVRI